MELKLAIMTKQTARLIALAVFLVRYACTEPFASPTHVNVTTNLGLIFSHNPGNSDMPPSLYEFGMSDQLRKIAPITYAGANTPLASPVLRIGKFVYGTLVTNPAARGSSQRVLYRMSVDGENLTILWKWTKGDHERLTFFGHTYTMYKNSSGDGSLAGLCEGNNGLLYGATIGGGSHGLGTIFSFNSKDGRYRLLYAFGTDLTNPTHRHKHLDTRDGASPWQQLAYDGTYLYGTATLGGLYGHGVLFRLNPANSQFKVLHDFSSESRSTGEGNLPQRIIFVHSTTIVGVMPTGGKYGNGIIYAISTNGADYRVLHIFGPTSSTDRAINPDGMNPLGIVQMQRNYLFGITSWGGRYGGGTVFEMRPDGTGFKVIEEEGDKHDICGVLPVRIWDIRGKIVIENSSGGKSDDGTLLILTRRAGKVVKMRYLGL